jgi:hypothetical protein
MIDTVQSQSAAEPKQKSPLLRRALVVLGWAALVPLVGWAAAALYFDLRWAWLRTPAAVLFIIGLVLAFIFIKPRWRAALVFAGAFLVVLAWWLSLRPSNNRDWLPDLAVTASADINGNNVTLHNIRNCNYRSETDFDVRYYDKAYDLDKLRTADLYMVYWGSPHMAHTMVSFGFEGGDYVCFSIETRKEKGEGYSAVKGLFRQFELIYVVGDERDLVRLRTNYRPGEDAYLYRIRASPEKVRTFFLGYLRRVNSLHQRPEWYSALTHNCTTSIRNQRAAADRAPWDWRMLANGHGDKLLYERGAIVTNLPFAELKQRSLINERAKAADQAPDFSQQIRVGIPGI